MSQAFTRRPLLGFALAFVVGALLGRQAAAHPLALLLSAALLLGLHLTVRFCVTPSPRRSLAGACLYPAAFLVAWAMAGMQVHPPSIRSVSCTALPPPSQLALIADVTGDPVGRELWSGRRMRWRFPVTVVAQSADRGHSWTRTRGSARITWYGWRESRPPTVGERWMIAAQARPQSYVPYRGTTADPPAVQSRDQDSLFLSSGHGRIFQRGCLAGRREAGRTLSTGIEHHRDIVSILHSLLLGLRQEMSREMRFLFASTGTFHIFAISGLHVGIFAGIVLLALSITRVPRVYWFACLAPILVAYTVSTGARPSAVRACTMALIYFAAPLFRRRSDAVSAVSAAAVLLLAWDPSQIRDLGFIFSFTVVLGLIILYPVCEAPFKGLFAKDPFRVRTEPKPVQWIRSTGKYVTSLLAASCAAWLTSAPLMAYYFERFAPIALPGNLFAIPLTFLIVFTGCLSLVFGSWIPLAADLFNHANLALASALVGSIRTLSTVPGSHMKIDPIPLWGVFVWYALLLFGAFRWHARRVDGFGAGER